MFRSYNKLASKPLNSQMMADCFPIIYVISAYIALVILNDVAMQMKEARMARSSF